MAPDRGIPPDIEASQPRVTEARPASPTPTPARSQSRSYNPAPTELDLDTLSTDTTDSLREQVRRVHQRLDEVQKEVLKSREDVRESSKGGSPFTPEIQSKPLPATFRLPALEPYDGSGDPMEHIATFCTQMALYDTSEALIFSPQTRGIPDLHPSLAIQAFLTGLSPSRFFWSLIERSPMTLPKMLQRAHQYMAAETLIAGKRDETKRSRGEQSRGHPAPPPKRREDRECDHDTEECRDLQYQIEDLIWRGHLRRYVREQPSLPDGRPSQDSSPRPQGPIEKQIDVIFGGPASGGNSSSMRKAYARSEAGKRPLHHEDLNVTFRSEGEEHSSYDDVLVISIRMANAYVKRVMIDILYFNAFQKLGLTDRDLAPLTSTLTGFTGDSVSPLGATTIPVTFGGEPRSKTLLVSFMVVKLPSAYNAIIGHPTLNRLRAVVSTYHRILKFPTRTGVGEVRSDPRESRQCYLTATTLFKKSRTEPV
ncbi:hypothetical protein BHE74_00022201, partial [Ensete ventricosum]